MVTGANKGGSRQLQLWTKDWVAQIILDEPPQGLHEKWTTERVEYYKRLEPSEPLMDNLPAFPSSSKPNKRMRLSGLASDAVWAAVFSNESLPTMKFLDDMSREQSMAL